MKDAEDGRHPNDLTTDEEIDASLEEAKAFENFPRIVEANFLVGVKVPHLHLRLSDGQDLLIPRGMLSELNQASDEQASEITIDGQGISIWWPQIDDGLYLPDFLEFRWGKVWSGPRSHVLEKYGNNAAISCPACSEVYLVSALLNRKRGRVCPYCSGSLAFIREDVVSVERSNTQTEKPLAGKD